MPEYEYKMPNKAASDNYRNIPAEKDVSPRRAEVENEYGLMTDSKSSEESIKANKIKSINFAHTPNTMHRYPLHYNDQTPTLSENKDKLSDERQTQPKSDRSYTNTLHSEQITYKKN